MTINTLQDLPWSTRGVIPEGLVPPLAIPNGSRPIRGRSGDLLVIRVKGRGRLNARQLNTLRSLNLREIGSAALCDSRASNTWGMIDSLHGHLAVVQYGMRISLERVSNTGHSSIDHICYGSNSQPAELTRASTGDYFAFESDRENVRVMWSSDLGFDQALEAFELAYGRNLGSDNGDSLAVIKNGDGDKELIEGSRDDTLAAVSRASDVRIVKVAGQQVAFTWKAFHRPFDDVDFETCEIGLNSANVDFDNFAASSLARETGPQDVLDLGECEVIIRIKGKEKKIPFARSGEF